MSGPPFFRLQISAGRLADDVVTVPLSHNDNKSALRSTKFVCSFVSIPATFIATDKNDIEEGRSFSFKRIFISRLSFFNFI